MKWYAIAVRMIVILCADALGLAALVGVIALIDIGCDRFEDAYPETAFVVKLAILSLFVLCLVGVVVGMAWKTAVQWYENTRRRETP